MDSSVCLYFALTRVGTAILSDQSAISRIELTGGSVLYRQEPPVVLVLNQLSDFVFGRLLNGVPKRTIATELKQRLPTLTSCDIEHCIEEASESLDQLLADDPSDDLSDKAPPTLFDQAAWSSDWIIKVGSSAMRLQIASDHFDDLMCSIYEPAILDQPNKEEVKTHLQVVAIGDDYWLRRDGSKITGPFNHHGAYLEMQQHLLSTAHAPRRTPLIMHASAILDETSNGSIILAGGSGSGKSSLTAAFLARGYGFIADDTAIIDADTKELWCIRLPLRLKEGTWELVQPYVSETFSTWEAIDDPSGRKIWRLHPKRDLSQQQPLAPACSAILFPIYEAHAETEIYEIETLASLALMVESGAWFDTNEPAMIDIIDWLSRTRCYSVIYSSAEDVVTAIEDQLRSDAAPKV